LSEFQITLPQLGITTGDPAGIGPEISLLAAQEECFQGSCRMVLFGSWNVLKSRAAEMGIPFHYEKISPDILTEGSPLPMRGIVDIPAEGIVAGTGSKESGEASAQNIIECTNACLRGPLDAIVTAPINKKYFLEAGYSFPGHTEFLAHLAGAPEIAMAFLTKRLKVVLATIHEPLKVVVATLSSDLIYRKLSILLTEFPRLGLPCKRVAVAGLNPHAGESGIIGSEDEESILPGIQAARKAFPEITIEGPLPGDTLFYRAYNGEFDVVLAMYHDQGLAPIKLIGFGESVNVTLGLPFIRTSVDHGTAYELAGKGIARHDSMNSAIHWAMRLAEGKRNFEKTSSLKS
jgi:4-phospho-D-threonate 3-dehydrogenase / 4-phospho-D-erythronate 3-dehydrogenase